MFQLTPLLQLEDMFLPHSQRTGNAVFGIRLSGQNAQTLPFLSTYVLEAKSKGLLQEEKLPNPAPNHIAFYQEMLGQDFRLEEDFLQSALGKWLPRLSPQQNKVIASAMLTSLDELLQQGKNLNMLKNLFIKFMCWMYYRLEQLLRQLGKDEVPKILYQGDISDYELRMFAILQQAGCDLLLLTLAGDSQYQSLDPQNRYTQLFLPTAAQPFPQNFSLQELIRQESQKSQLSGLYQGSSLTVSSNAWKQGKALEDVLLDNTARQGTAQQYFPQYRQLLGVESKGSYSPQLYQVYQELGRKGRSILLLDSLPLPSPQEAEQLPQGNFRDLSHMLGEYGRKLSYPKHPDLQKLLVKAYIETLLEDHSLQQESLPRQKSHCGTLFLWLQRYQSELFSKWSPGSVSVCFYLQGKAPQKPLEQMFLRLLSRLPVDVLVLAPNLSQAPLPEPWALVEEYPQSLELSSFPTEQRQMGTTAFHAEQELEELMYQDSGMYRNRQHSKASSITLKTMYEEIAILWNQESSYRPNFFAQGEEVHIPVIFAKVSGVAQNSTNGYWSSIRQLVTEETLIMSKVPFISSGGSNPFLELAPQLFRQNTLNRKKIKEHKDYGYGFLRQEVQEHLLDKLELLLREKPVKGMGQQGTEHTVLALALTLPKEVLRLIQGFDFTKVPPKVLYLHCKEAMPSVEDSILLAYLNLLGFDIVMFVPTGYQCVEVHYTKELLEEHQVGGYRYDLNAPKLSSGSKKLFGNKLFRRGE